MSKFKERLAREIPAWVQKGWVTRQNGDEILKNVSSGDSKSPNKLVFALLILGVILLGSGVVTFFAAHWNGMAKIFKLSLLFGGIWTAYGLASWFRENHPDSSIWQAFLLLGVILFGSNIFLIAQIYHLDAHYPNGVLLWAAGALLTAIIMDAQAPIYPAIFLSVLWGGFETLNFDHPFFWQFLILWIAILFPIYKQAWKPAAHAAIIGLLVWTFMELVHYSFRNPWISTLIIESIFLAYLGLFLAGKILNSYSKTSVLSSPFQRYALSAQLFSLYFLTFPIFFERSWNQELTRRMIPVNGIMPWNLFFPALLGLNVLLMIWYWQKKESPEHLPLMSAGYGIIFLVLVLFGLNLMSLNGFILAFSGNLMAILFNLVFFGGLVWLVYYGVRTQETFIVNLSFAFFALTLVSRY
ncbi:MAG TPA: DUF2157 domain-containing protein, partial [Nitrospiria bacterium]|nr:DUF2157 domain-containing protein [Nitrospiria bacterium]